MSDDVFLPPGFPPRDADFVLQLAVAPKWPDRKLGFKRLQLRGGTVQNVFSRFCACAMRDSLFLPAVGAVDALRILSLLFRHCSLNADVLRGHWLYSSMLATVTVGESLLKKRHIPCIFLLLPEHRAPPLHQGDVFAVSRTSQSPQHLQRPREANVYPNRRENVPH